MVMRLFENPFYILKVTPNSTKSEIREAADDLELESDDGRARELASMLMNPTRRVEAEVCWFPELSEDEAQTCINILENSWDFDSIKEDLEDKVFYTDFAICSQVNCYYQALKTIDETDADEYLYDAIEVISQKFDELDAEDLMETMNYDREDAGFPAITDINLVYRALDSQKSEIIKAFHEKLNVLDTNDMISTITDLIENLTDNGESPAPSLIYNLIDDYEKETQTFFENNTPVLHNLINNINVALKNNNNDARVPRMVNQLINALKTWDKIAQPIQVAKQSKGLEDDRSLDLAWEVRNLAIDLHNNYGLTALSKQIAEAMQDIFAESFTVSEKVEDDVEVLSEMQEKERQYEAKRAAQELRERQEAAKEAAYMRYSATTGMLLNKKEIYIDNEAFTCNGHRIPFNSITKMKWGSTITRTNIAIVPTTIRTHTLGIVYGNNQTSNYTFNGKQDGLIFSNITDRLWRGAGVRIIADMAQQLKNGYSLEFGTAKIEDQGIWIDTAIFSTKFEFFPWNKIKLSRGNGEFLIATKDGKNEVGLWYESEWNVHMLEALMRVAFDKGYTRLSQVMG